MGRPPTRYTPVERSVWGSLFFVVPAFFVTIRSVSGWSDEVHQAIGMVAMSALDSKTTHAVKRLAGGNDLADIGSWGHQLETSYPETVPLHFQFQTVPKKCANLTFDDTNCANNRCLVRALQSVYAKLAGLSTDVPGYVDVQLIANVRLTEADLLKLFVNLIAHLHQPLRLGFLENKGGQTITIQHPAINTQSPRSTNLFDYWETEIAQQISTTSPHFWFGGWTHITSLGKDRWAQMQKEWNQMTPQDHLRTFELWGIESLNIVCTDIQRDLRSGAAITSGFQTSPSYTLTLFSRVLRDRILLAGARTALILNYVLASRDPIKLRQNSALSLTKTQPSIKFFSGSLSHQTHLLRTQEVPLSPAARACLSPRTRSGLARRVWFYLFDCHGCDRKPIRNTWFQQNSSSIKQYQQTSTLYLPYKKSAVLSLLLAAGDRKKKRGATPMALGPSTDYLTNFCINGVIMVTVLGAFIYIVKYYTPGPTILTLRNSGSPIKEVEKRS